MGDERLQKRYYDTLPFSVRDNSFIISVIQSNVGDEEHSVYNKQHAHRPFSQKSALSAISQSGLHGRLRQVLDTRTAVNPRFNLQICSLWQATKFNLNSGEVP